MSATEVFRGSSYEIVAWARGHEVLLYETYGSYQGEWLLFARDPKTGEYLIYKGSYGSCSGCDSYQAWEPGYSSYDDETGEYTNSKITREKAMEFAADYPPFIEIPRATAIALAENGTLESVFPANVNDDYGSEVNVPEFSRDATAHIKLIEGLPFSVEEIWATGNMELRRRAWDAYGVEKFVTDSGMTELHREGEDALVRLAANGAIFLLLKDASTPRRYLLRVPPEMTRVREAKAWSFGLNEHEYRPEVET